MHSKKRNALCRSLKAVLLAAGGLFIVCVVHFGMISASADTTYLISDNGRVRYVTSASDDPEEILDEAGLELGIDDTYTVTENNGYPGIYVQRIQTVTIDNGGQLLKTGTYGETVGELLERLQVVWDEDDEISERLEAKTYDGMEISISRKTYATETHSQSLPYSTQYHADPELPAGEQRILTAGADGEVQCTAEVTYENGQEIERKLLSREVTLAPVDQVVAVGTASADSGKGQLTIGDGFIVTPEGDVLTYTRHKTMRATAYSCEETGGEGITAIGTPARVGAIAVDPTVIPYGTRMYIVTKDQSVIYGVATAEDTGHPDYIYGNRIDLYYDTVAECVQFGVRDCDVYILG